MKPVEGYGDQVVESPSYIAIDIESSERDDTFGDKGETFLVRMGLKTKSGRTEDVNDAIKAVREAYHETWPTGTDYVSTILVHTGTVGAQYTDGVYDAELTFRWELVWN